MLETTLLDPDSLDLYHTVAPSSISQIFCPDVPIAPILPVPPVCTSPFPASPNQGATEPKQILTGAPVGLFSSFFLGGFECSSHRNGSGQRLHLLSATGHDCHAHADYERLQQQGISAARDGVAWHEIEPFPNRFDFSRALPLVRAAHETGTQVIWDLCHYGWPDDVDVFSPKFIWRFARFAQEFARILTDESDVVPFFAPMNEISFFSWAAGEVGCMHPLQTGRGLELKAQLVRATIAAIEAIWEVAPQARIVHPDPAIHVHPDPVFGEDLYTHTMAQGYTHSMFESWDFLAGKRCPELGGRPEYLDIIGVNYYSTNQWIFRNTELNASLHVWPGDPRYRPFRYLLRDIYERYQRPLFLSETGADGEERVGWLRYIGEETRAAMAAGIPIEGICLYPICTFPDWDDGRVLENGLWCEADETGHRAIHTPLAEELAYQQALFAACRR